MFQTLQVSAFDFAAGLACEQLLAQLLSTVDHLNSDKKYIVRMKFENNNLAVLYNRIACDGLVLVCRQDASEIMEYSKIFFNAVVEENNARFNSWAPELQLATEPEPKCRKYEFAARGLNEL